jgi:membrane fusion protein, multidrug efflux system
MIHHSLRTFLALTLLLAACHDNQPRQADSKPSATPQATVPTVTTTTVESGEVSRTLRLPGELRASQEVILSPKVSGFVESIRVDRGSTVRSGELLVRLGAAEINSRRSEQEATSASIDFRKTEAEAHVNSVRAQRLEVEARLAAATSAFRRLKSAAATPGVVSGNELENAQRLVEAETARVNLFRENEVAARAQVEAFAETAKAARASIGSARAGEEYLRILAPFNGVITERNVHPGSLAVPGQPLLRLQQISKLRMIVNLPEAEVAGIGNGRTINFTVPAFPGQTFKALVARIARSIDQSTRTMPIELDVDNRDLHLAPGMFPQIVWPVSRPTSSMLVPPTAVAVTTERTFVIRIRDGVTEWVEVKRGISVNLNGRDLVEIFGELTPGDVVALRGTDELRAGTKVNLNK